MESEEIIFCDLCNTSIPKNAPYAVANGKKVCSKCLTQLAPSIPARREGLGLAPETPKEVRPWGMGPLRAGFLWAIGASLWTWLWWAVIILIVIFLFRKEFEKWSQILQANTLQQQQLMQQFLQGTQPGTGGTMEELLPELFPGGKAPEAPFEEGGATEKNSLRKRPLLAKNNRNLSPPKPIQEDVP